MTRLQRLLPSRRAAFLLALALVFAQVVFVAAFWHMSNRQMALAMQEGRYVQLFIETGMTEGLLRLPAATTRETPSDPAPGIEEKPAEPDSVPAGLALAPFNPELSEKGENGAVLPVMGKDGTKPWQYYANNAPLPGGKPMVAILVTGVGIGTGASDLALKLPPQVSISLSPYTPDTKPWTDAIRVRGHELFLDLPVQTVDYPITDPGPLALLNMNMPQENVVRLKDWMGKTTAYVGAYTPREETFFASREVGMPVLKEIAQRGLMVVMGNNGARPEVDKMLEEAAGAFITSDIQLDISLDPDSVDTQLAAAVSTARERGYVIAVTRPYPMVLKKLDKWIESLSNQGIILVPVSTLVRKKFS